MAPSNAKEEIKRKRAAEAQESSAQTTKKVKREQKSNGVASETAPPQKKTSVVKAGVEVTEVTAPQEDKPLDAETIRRQQDKQKSKDKKKRKKDEKRSAKDTLAAENESADVEDEKPEINGAVEDEPAAGQQEHVPEPKSAQTIVRQEERVFTRQELIDKFRRIAEAKEEGLDVDRKLHVLLRDTRKYTTENNLSEDDELVQLYSTHKEDSGSLWRVSPSIGGCYIDQDPLFSVDEKYIILATAGSIHVYEAENSLLVRSIRAFGTTCYALSSARPHHLYVGTQHGDVSQYDWTTGRWLSTVQAGKGIEIRALYAARLSGQDDALYTIEKQPQPIQNGKQKEGTKIKHRHVLRLRKASANGIEDVSHQLHETRGRLRHIRVLDNRNTIVLAGDEQMIVGSLVDSATISDALVTEDTDKLDTSYRWRKSTTTQSITCIDTFSKQVTIRLPSGAIDQRISHAIALGNAKGEVLIYDDVVAELEKLETASESRSLVPRILRWHREAPNTVKWSKDGMKMCVSASKPPLTVYRQLRHLRR